MVSKLKGSNKLHLTNLHYPRLDMHCPVQQLYITMYTLNLPYLTHLTMSHLPPLPHQIFTLPATLATLKLNIVRAAPFYNKGGRREERVVAAGGGGG